MVAAGSLDFEDALRLVRRRGELMQEHGAGAMAAILGLAAEDVAAIAQDAGAEVANFNTPVQTTVSGTTAAVERAIALAKERGAKRALLLPVSGAFHSTLMAPVAEAMRPLIDGTAVHAGRVPLVADLDARFLRDPSDLRDELVDQICGSVRWVDVVGALVGAGVTTFYEIGPGQVLAGLIGRCAPEATVFTAERMVADAVTAAETAVSETRSARAMSEASGDQRAGVAVVTGGTRGIGLAVAKRLVADGYDVLLTYKGDAEAAEAAKSELSGSDRQVEAIAADISTAEGAGMAIEAAMQQLGRLDVLINNAGITRDTLLMRMNDEDWDDVLTTNLKGAFLTSKAAIRPMLRQRSGRIVNISSVVGQVGNAGQANYAAAKAGLIGFTKSLAKEVGSRGITVNAIAPGFIDTRMTAGLPDETKATILERTPLNRFGTPEDVAGAVAFLIGPDASFITGHTLTVDGGLFMP